MTDEIGELSGEHAELRLNWRIPNFLSLPKKVGKEYRSRNFPFFDSSWCLDIYPNGVTVKSDEWIALYLWKVNPDSPTKVSYSCGVKNVEGEIENLTEGNHTFTKGPENCGWPEFLKISEFQDRREKLAPSGTLTIVLNIMRQHPIEGSLFGRLLNLSRTMKEILFSEERTDVTLKLKDGEIPAHRIILESRSAVFKRMFGVDMREREIGEVHIEDATVGAFRVALRYAYSGVPEGLNRENVTEVYRVAHKYEFEELKKLCASFMHDTLNLDTIYDVVALANLHQEMTLKESAKDYFNKNKTKVFKTEMWKTLKRDNPVLCCEVVECVFGEDV